MDVGEMVDVKGRLNAEDVEGMVDAKEAVEMMAWKMWWMWRFFRSNFVVSLCISFQRSVSITCIFERHVQ